VAIPPGQDCFRYQGLTGDILVNDKTGETVEGIIDTGSPISMISEGLYRKYFSQKFLPKANNPFRAYGVGTDGTDPMKGAPCALYINATIDLRGGEKENSIITLSGEIHIITHGHDCEFIIGNNILRPAKPIIALNAGGSGMDLLIVDGIGIIVRSLNEKESLIEAAEADRSSLDQAPRRPPLTRRPTSQSNLNE
jgi:hypothetical protein